MRRVGGAVAVATGALSNVENGVVGCRLDPATAGDVVADLVGWLARDRRVPASWLCAEAPEPPDFPALLERAGCRAERSGIDMGSHLDRLPAAPPLQGVRVVRADDEPVIAASFDVFAACGWYDEPGDLERRHEIAWSLGGGRVRRWVAFRGDRAVGAITSFTAGDTVLLHDLAVVEDERRRGVGRALLLTAVDDARAAGCDVAVLAPTPDGRKLAEAVGFEVAPTPADRWFYLPLETAARKSSRERGKTETLPGA